MNTKILSDEVYNNIFNFWKLQEYFAPSTYPEGVSYFNEYSPRDLLFDKGKLKKAHLINIYFGCYKLKVFAEKMAEKCGLDMKKHIDISELSGRFYIFSMQIDSDGKPASEKSFQISPFFYVLISMMKTGGKNAEITEKAIRRKNEDINEILKQNETVIQRFEDLDYIKNILFHKLEIPSEQEVGLEAASKKNIAYKGLAEGERDNILNSFFLNDIELVQKGYKQNAHLTKYITALIIKNPKKIMIDSDMDAMQKWLETDRYPLAKYPSKFSPTLMQQIAINIAISEKDRNEKIFSVNGPPGTGKTTLLKEIIASNVEKSAETLIDYGIDGINRGGFQKCAITSESTSTYTDWYYKIPEDIAQYGILIASSNNGAIENITLDLPKASGMAEDKTRTGLFDRTHHPEIYFSAVADELLNESGSAWGLISACMGKRENIKKVLNFCTFKTKSHSTNEDRATLDSIKDDSISWEEAIFNFKQAKEKVLSFRKEIKKDRQLLSSFYHTEDALEKENSLLIKLYSDMEETKQKLKEVQESLNANEHSTLQYEDEIKYIKKHASFFKRLLTLLFLGSLGKQIAEKKKQINALILEHGKLSQDCTAINEKTNELGKNIEKQKNRIAALKKEMSGLESSVYGKTHSLKAKYAENLADRNFYQNIKSSENSQNACPWTFPAYDKAREALFFAALQVRKAFILESKCIRRNLFVYALLYNKNKYTEAERIEIFPHLLNALSIVIPAISSTFASMENFLKYAGNKSLGMLIIDEAGQAVPYSALGALYRTQSAIVVGDPLQIEPVVTMPQILTDLLADSAGIPNDYKRSDNSVQTFADCMNEFNGMIGERQVGCPLVVHRRCIEPMFSISNKISYDNRMFNQTYKKEEVFLIKKSGWIDVKGPENGPKDHFVEAQAVKICQLLEHAAQIYKDFFYTNDKIFIITPFKTVSESMKEYIIKYFSQSGFDKEALNTWVRSCIGTVHTFQGKDANEVLFVLGCSAESAGAMNWVVKNPNILNVACTRAKYRIAFIGNMEDWKDKCYFNDFVPEFIDTINL